MNMQGNGTRQGNPENRMKQENLRFSQMDGARNFKRPGPAPRYLMLFYIH